MTRPPTMSPEEFHAHLADAVGDLQLGSPPITVLQHRAARRRHVFAASIAGIAAAVVGAVAIPLALNGSSTGGAVVQIGHPTTAPHHGPPPRPLPSLGGTPTLSRHQQVLHDYPKRCGGRYDRWHLVQGLSASVPGGAVIQIIGHPGYVRCGGPSDIAYLHHRRIENLTLAPGAEVRVVVVGSIHRHSRPIDPSNLRAYVRHHAESTFYRYAGPKDAITKLIELYHP
jgi:hypothetical protein